MYKLINFGNFSFFCAFHQNWIFLVIHYETRKHNPWSVYLATRLWIRKMCLNIWFMASPIASMHEIKWPVVKLDATMVVTIQATNKKRKKHENTRINPQLYAYILRLMALIVSDKYFHLLQIRQNCQTECLLVITTAEALNIRETNVIWIIMENY